MRNSIIAALVAISFGSVAITAQAGKPYGKHLCKQDGYHCKKIRYGQTWSKLFPNKRERNIVKAVNRTNMPLYYRKFIVIPDNLSNLTMLDVAPFPHIIDPPGERLVEVNLRELAFAAYSKHGKLLHWGPVSGGKPYCPDVDRACHTIKGEFRVYSERGKHCRSNTYPIETDGGAHMPYCMFFKGGYAMHASTTVPGYHASHGCVRMSYPDARWLSKHFVATENGGTKVIVN